jgi:hypothetical protein
MILECSNGFVNPIATDATAYGHRDTLVGTLHPFPSRRDLTIAISLWSERTFSQCRSFFHYFHADYMQLGP